MRRDEVPMTTILVKRMRRDEVPTTMTPAERSTVRLSDLGHQIR
jgi:hypothetical protein